MSRLGARMMENRRPDPPPGDGLNSDEQAALETMRREASAQRSALTSGGKGGLPPSLVLHVMRRDGYRCKNCGEVGGDENGGIGVHHKGGVVASRWLSKKGHANEPNNLVTICNRCHDRTHGRARAAGIDASQVTPEGDKHG